MPSQRLCPECSQEMPQGSPFGLCGECLIGTPREADSGASAVARGSRNDNSARVGAAVGGRYNLVRILGSGGMGDVWMAEQREPVTRTVALKIIKEGLDSAQIVARFEAERQALALMSHPNIAMALDGGTMPDGRPYFVMELVDGIPITKYCDERGLGIRERLELFVSVCHAIQHAHDKGVIHRDIKPTNVLVTAMDGRHVPKVIDFGVAKAAGQRLTDKTIVTHYCALIGTLTYMSPEQAGMNKSELDLRSDVYSLGIVLYELLTGATPLFGDWLKEAAFDEMLLKIRTETPPRPSMRARRSALSDARASDWRRLDTGWFGKVQRDDLDWIVMKTIEKDPSARYQTAGALAQDIQSYLDGGPVIARSPGLWYRFQKVARRHKAAVAAAAAVILSLSGGLGVAVWQAVRATEAKEAAERAAEAEHAARRAVDQLKSDNDEASFFVLRLLSSSGIFTAETKEERVRGILEAAESRLASPKLPKQFRTAVLSALGDVMKSLERYDRATNWLGQAASAWREMANEPGAGDSIRRELSRVLSNLAWAELGNKKDPAGLKERAVRATAAARESYEIREALDGPNDDSVLNGKGDWLFMRYSASGDTLSLFKGFFELLAAGMEVEPDQFRSRLTQAVKETSARTRARDAEGAREVIRRFLAPLVAENKPKFRGRMPFATAQMADGLGRLEWRTALRLPVFLGWEVSDADLRAAMLPMAEVAHEMTAWQPEDRAKVAAILERVRRQTSSNSP